MNYLSNLDENYREKLLCYPYSDKARALLLAHFQRLELPPATVAIGRQTCSQKQYHTVSKNPQETLTIVTNPLRSLSGLWQVKHARTHLNILVYGKNTPSPRHIVRWLLEHSKDLLAIGRKIWKQFQSKGKPRSPLRYQIFSK